MAPLSKFIKKRDVNGQANSQTATICSEGVRCDEDPSGGPKRSTQCCNSRSQGQGYPLLGFSARSAPKSERSQRHRKSKTHRRHTTKPKFNKIPNLSGRCLCGAEALGVYGNMCEDCYANMVYRWPGKDQSATIHW